MNKMLIWVLGAIIVVGGGLFLLLGAGNAPSDSMINKDETKMEDGSMTEKDSMMKEDNMKGGDAMMQKGSYEPYAPEKLAKADSGDVVLFFRASWCPTCRALDSNIKADLSAIPSTLTILDVDYDNSAALKQKYGVTYQHTLVQVNADGSLVKKWSGSPTLAALVAEVQ